MARKIRYIIPQLPHHALQRGNNRQAIFLDQDDRRYFLSCLKKKAEEQDVRIGAYCLMTNHFHLLLYPEAEEGLIKFMKSISQLHSQGVNRKYGRTGKLWENRYKLNIVEPECEWVIARYIEQNPVRAGMVTKAEAYEYSSARMHLEGKQDQIISRDIVGDRIKEYKEYFENESDNTSKQLEEIRMIIRQEKAIGRRDFIEQLEKRFKISFQLRSRGRPKE